MISDELLEYLGDYFVNKDILHRDGITFSDFVSKYLQEDVAIN